jgi:hypothetical protein
MTFEPTLSSGIIFSDLVVREQGTGKSTIVGSFSTYNLPTFPYKVPPFQVTAFVTNLTQDVKAIDVAARVEHPQNGAVLASTAVKVQFSKAPTRNDVTEIYIPIVNLAFSEAGLFKVVILINNEKIGERNLQVNDIRSTTQSTQT